MASVKELFPTRKVGLHPIAFYRAFFENTPKLPDIADQYLETGRNLIDARHTLIYIEDAMMTLAARKQKSKSDIFLLKLPKAVLKSATDTHRMIARLKAEANQSDENGQAPQRKGARNNV